MATRDFSDYPPRHEGEERGQPGRTVVRRRGREGGGRGRKGSSTPYQYALGSVMCPTTVCFLRGGGEEGGGGRGRRGGERGREEEGGGERGREGERGKESK